MTRISLFAAVASFAFAASAGAAPGGQSSVEFTEGFVCPVITNENVLHSPKGITIADGSDGTNHYSIAGPHPPNVPVHATNQDGTGDPMGAHAAPGDEGYTAIWDVC